MRTPSPGSHNAKLLRALSEAAPDPLWHASSRLGITAHSRITDLRKMGWKIRTVRRPSINVDRSTDWGYVLLDDVEVVVTEAATPNLSAAWSEQLIPASAIIKRTGLTRQDITRLRVAGLVMPVTPSGGGKYSKRTSDVFDAIAALHKSGLTVSTAAALVCAHGRGLMDAARCLRQAEERAA